MNHFRIYMSKLLKEYLLDQEIDGKTKSRVHFQTANNKPPYPYAEYNFLPSFIQGGQEVFLMDVDLWDNKLDTTEIDDLQTRIWKDLDRIVHNDEYMQFSIYRESRYPDLDEKELGIRRRKMTFQIRYFEK